MENDDEIPALHDYAKYGYSEKNSDGLRQWYIDYMSKNILNKENNQKIGLNEFAYTTQPINSSNFKYPIDIEFNNEPNNILEEIINLFKATRKGK